MHQLRTTRGRLLERFVTVSYINSKLPRMNVGGRNLSGSTLSKEYLTISNVSPGLKLRAFESRATEHPVIVSCLCTSRATIGAYFCISLGDSSLSQQPRRAILNCREQPRISTISSWKRKIQENNTLDFIARVVIFLANLTGPA